MLTFTKSIIKVILICIKTIGLFYFSIYIFLFLSPVLKTLLVETAMTTKSHQYLATLFVSQKEIKEILENNRIEVPEEEQDLSLVTVVENKGINNVPPPIAYAEEFVEEQEIYEEEIEEKEEEEYYTGYYEYSEGIYIKDVSGTGFQGKLALVTDPFRITVGVTEFLGEKGEKIADMATREEGVFALNGGWFYDPNYEGSGGAPTGYTFKDGNMVWAATIGSADIVGINNEGKLIVGNMTAKRAQEIGVMNAVSSIPILIQNGETYVKKGDGGWGIAPRSAIGQTQEGYILLLAIDGRQTHSIGATLRQVQDVMLENGAIVACGLDGGSSTVMWGVDGYINKPSLGRERRVPTCFIVK